MKRETLPSWLSLLLTTQFFLPCKNHPLSSRSECNLFCIECEAPPDAFCYHCHLDHHSNHHVIQIRRSSYHDVIKVSELEDILDISDVQTYVINSAKVVFLNERPQMRTCGPLSSSSYNCETCGRALLNEFRFCSLGCNLTGIEKDMKTPSDVANGSEYKRIEDVASGNSSDSNTRSEKEIYNENNEEEPPAKRVAHHRRKGIPQRAPFF
ncbi:protein RGF1 INDUCIBLE TRANSCRIPTION FACTOR 1 [Setaria viridis]|uniref:B box-type domain-containing protein n=1 Tax=Setaria viridis TaxID=4556 RepID=A0A4U6UUF9_SETVI|nr:uncharacterized protein At3g50808-like [Setaria viridis]TKW14777.1 hypothetical protein SEVIR_5G189200v2 [Setaria viridis]